MRQSRVGLDVGVHPRGRLERRLAGSSSTSSAARPGFVTGTVMGLPRLLYAFGRLERGRHGDPDRPGPRAAGAARSRRRSPRSRSRSSSAPAISICARRRCVSNRGSARSPPRPASSRRSSATPAPTTCSRRRRAPANAANGRPSRRHVGFDRGDEDSRSRTARRRVRPLRLEQVRRLAGRLVRRRRRLPGAGRPDRRGRRALHRRRHGRLRRRRRPARPIRGRLGRGAAQGVVAGVVHRRRRRSTAAPTASARPGGSATPATSATPSCD